MRQKNKVPYSSYEELKQSVVRAIIKLISRSRGTCVTFTGKKIALTANLPPQPVLLTVIRSILEELRKEGLISRYSGRSHGVRYIVTNNSPLWSLVKKRHYVETKSTTLRYAQALLLEEI